MYLYGKHSVDERLKANPRSIQAVFVQQDFSHPEIEALIRKHAIPLKRVSKQTLMSMKSAPQLQGIVARVDAFRYAEFDNLIALPAGQQVSFIFLDRVYDPQNLGAIIRTAACFGGFAVVIPKHRACEVTEAVLHVAQGAENYTPVARVVNLRTALLSAKQAGYWALGAVTSGGQVLSAVELPHPLCVVFGSEGEGLRYGLRKHLDIQACIPMKGRDLSFNVTIACAIFCYEIARQGKKSPE